MNWKKAPLARIVIPFVLGIAIGVKWSVFLFSYAFIPALLFFLLFLILHFYFRKLKYKLRWLPGFFISSALVFAGISLTVVNHDEIKPGFFTANYKAGDGLLLKIIKPPEEKNKTYKAFAQIQAVVKDNKLLPASGNILLYVKKDSSSRNINYGDVILTHSEPQLIPAPANPEEFDYKNYMALQNVHYNLFLNEKAWIKISSQNANPLRQFIYSIRSSWIKSFEEYIAGKDEQAIAKALVLGDVSELSPQLRTSYASTGTMHILAVSGLHVGFIFIGLSFLTAPLQRNRYGRIFRMLLIIAALWFYAILTGLSPSVFRAVTMFSFVAIGQNFRKITNTYNSIFTAALALLIIDPFLIVHVGFQLSFAAVIGIVWLQPKIQNLWKPENKIVSWLWSLTAVSVAAQIGTLPLSLYYFNQFPIYFILSNLIAIPAAMLILGAGFLFLLFKLIKLGFIYSLLGKIIYWIIFGLNYLMEKISGIPFSRADGIYISQPECILLYLFIICLAISFIKRNKTFLKLSLSLILLFLAQRIFFIFYTYTQPQIIVHNVPKNFVMSISSRDKLYVFGDSSFVNDESKINFLLARFAFKKFIPKENIILKPTGNNNVTLEIPGIYIDKYTGEFDNTKWMILNKSITAENLNSDAEIDYLIIDGNPVLQIKKIAENLNFRKLIITRNNSRYKAEKWSNECKESGIECMNMQKDNSFAVLK